MYRYLDQNAPWVRPSDTGRSTNCLINDAGIYIHKKERGFHNYALPYSWDVRMGHKTRAETIHELNDDLDESQSAPHAGRSAYDENEKLAQRAEKAGGLLRFQPGALHQRAAPASFQTACPII
jgi:hypothetical protein